MTSIRIRYSVAVGAVLVFSPGALPNDNDPIEAQQIAVASLQFSIQLYTELCGSASRGGRDANLVICPLGTMVAMCMTSAMAVKGETQNQILQALHIDKISQDRVHPAMSHIWRSCEIALPGASVHSAAGMWVHNSAHIDRAIHDRLRHYIRKPFLVDFSHPEACRNEINRWAQQKSLGRIRETLGPGSISPMSRVVIVTLLSFRCPWQSRFDPTRTKPGVFGFREAQTEVQYMMQTLRVPYGRCNMPPYPWVIVLPFEGDLELMILLPEADRLQALEESLSVGLLEECSRVVKPTNCDLKMPRVTVRWQGDLAEPLKTLGIGIERGGLVHPDWYISAVGHSVDLRLNEWGGKGSAATSVVIAAAPNASGPTPVWIDRPFLFLVRSKAAFGSVLLLGRCVRLGDEIPRGPRP